MKRDLVKQFKKPVQAFSCCPQCKCEELISCGVDILCARCDWLSCEVSVAAGGMDNLIGAYLEHFGAQAVKDEINKSNEKKQNPNLEFAS